VTKSVVVASIVMCLFTCCQSRPQTNQHTCTASFVQ